MMANFVIPIVLGHYCGESFTVLWHGNIYRYLIMLHLVWMVNSVAHIWGEKPYDKNISPTDSWYVHGGKKLMKEKFLKGRNAV